MFKWEKLGKVFDPSEHDTPEWMQQFAQAPCAVLFDDFVRIYFSCRPKPDEKGQYTSYSAYVDLDRNNLFKIKELSEVPILPLGDLGNFDEFGIYPVSVIKDKELFKLYYAGWTRCESVPFNVNIGYATSIDNGKTFTKLGKGPILSYSLDEPFVLSGPKIRKFNGRYYLFYIAGSKWILDKGKPEPIYKIRMAESADGINWKKLNKNIILNKIEENEAQASPDVFFLNGKYRMFFCYRHSKGYRSKTGGYRIGYAESSDLINWDRKDDMAGIDVSETGWDSEMVSYPHIFMLEDEIYMFYLGNGVGKNGFGMAKLKNLNEIDEVDK
ncbi:hypothetical protein [Bizionia paragorgiae]|uniref:hypothetical protein n=1 Tax=Bizionia paragorgiae TaxID=283786 RepID=UPI003A8F1892